MAAPDKNVTCSRQLVMAKGDFCLFPGAGQVLHLPPLYLFVLDSIVFLLLCCLLSLLVLVRKRLDLLQDTCT